MTKSATSHESDASVSVLLDIVLRQGKKHEVRRIVKEALGLRVGYLSRVRVEGLEGQSVEALQSVGGLEEWAGEAARARAGAVLLPAAGEEGRLMGPGEARRLTGSEVDRIFGLRS